MVTVADLYSHRSGLPDHAGDQLEDIGYDRRQVLERLRYLPLRPFRITYAYTNFGLTAAAEAVAAAAGKSWEELSARRCCTGRWAWRRRVRDSPIPWPGPTARSATSTSTAGTQPRYERDPDAQSPAGGVSSSVNDMAQWLTMVLADGSYNGKRIVDPEALLPAITPQVCRCRGTPSRAARSGFYGYGFNVSVTTSGAHPVSHPGAFELGAATNFVVLPSADVGDRRADQRRAVGRARDADRPVRRPGAVRRDP